MRSVNSSTAEFTGGESESGIFNVVIAYEDFETGKQAKRAYDCLVKNLAEESAFNSPMWKFDVLSIPKLQEMAIADAQSADIIIIACRGGSELPEPVRQWMEGWITAGTRAVALVALFDCEPANAAPMHEYLRDAAHKAGLQFFAQPDYWPSWRGSLQAGDCDQRDKLTQRAVSHFSGVMPESLSETPFGISR